MGPVLAHPGSCRAYPRDDLTHLPGPQSAGDGILEQSGNRSCCGSRAS